MFAVPGWSVPASLLKAQLEPQNPKAPSKDNENRKRIRKRKRGQKDVEITQDNVGNFWKKFVGMKDSGGIKAELREGNGERAGQGCEEPKWKGKRKNTSKNAIERFQDAHKPVEGFEGGDAMAVRKEVTETAAPSAREAPSRDDETLQTARERMKVRDGQGKDQTKRKKRKKAQLHVNGTLPPKSPPRSDEAAQDTYYEDPLYESMANGLTARPESTENTLKSRKITAAQELQGSSTTIATATGNGPSKQQSLTPLQRKMADKLTSARFRHLNQTLYTSSSADAKKLFSENPQAYESYHHGFRAQVASWPSNPIEEFISDIELRGAVRAPTHKQMLQERRREKRATRDGKKSHKNPTLIGNPEPTNDTLTPLPRDKSTGFCTIIDLGCGDAHLAASLSPLSAHHILNLHIRSFDLAKGDTPQSPLIEVADISDLRPVGVGDASVDIAICCLSLMGTNWVDVVSECGRVVREGGEMWVAEIRSRFGRIGDYRKGQIGERKGQKLKKGKTRGKGRKRKRNDDSNSDDDTEDDYHRDNYEDDDALLALEDLSHPHATRNPYNPTTSITSATTNYNNNKNEETELDININPFTQIFQRRGFLLVEQPDKGNRMFVKMKFVKNSLKAKSRDGRGPGGKKNLADGRRRFVDERENERKEEEEEEEGRALKPCVYKTR